MDLQYGDHDLEDVNQAPHKMTNTLAIENPVVLNQCKALEERLKNMEGYDAFDVNALTMGLIPDVVIPPKFKVYDFERYKWLTCPRNHLRMYCRKMHSYAQDQEH